MPTLIVANWKMHPTLAKEAKKLLLGTVASVSGVKGVQVAVCPPALFLPELAKELRGRKAIELGAQDVSTASGGAHTGELSLPMLLPYKVKWVILGHSERRERGETNDDVRAKVRVALAGGVHAIVCVGERERSDDGTYYTFVRDEVAAALADVKRADLARITLAYEPVWAIGKSADHALQAGDLFEMSLFLRKLLVERFGRPAAASVPILYGGSVKPENAAALIRDGGVQGLLIGSASLDPRGFGEIVRAAGATV